MGEDGDAGLQLGAATAAVAVGVAGAVGPRWSPEGLYIKRIIDRARLDPKIYQTL